MLARNSWFVAGCSLASALAILASAPTRSRADVAVSYVHIRPPETPLVSYDTITYSCNVSGTPYCMGWALRMKDWGATEPSQATDAGTENSILGGSGGASNGSTTDWRPYRFVNSGVWIAYHIHGVLSDGSGTLLTIRRLPNIRAGTLRAHNEIKMRSTQLLAVCNPKGRKSIDAYTSWYQYNIGS